MDNTAQPSTTTTPSSDPNEQAAPATPTVPETSAPVPSEASVTPPPPADPPAAVPADPPSTPTPADPPVQAPVEAPKTDPEPAAPAPADPPAQTPPPPPPADPPAQPAPAETPAPEAPKTEPAPAPVAPPVSETPAPTPVAPAATNAKPAETPAPSLTENQTPPPPAKPQGKHFHISPWTLVLIVVLLGFSGFFLYVAVSPKMKPTPVAQAVPTPTPIPVAQSVLSLQPAPTGTPTAQMGTQTYDVMIDTSTNTVNAVQLELSYDPSVLTNVSVTPGTFFTNPLQLVKDIDTVNGRISYALGIQPKDKGVKGTGVVAEVKFQFQPTATVSSTMLSFLPKTLVAAQGVNPSVLKSATNATIVVPHPQGTKTQLQPTVPPPAAQH